MVYTAQFDKNLVITKQIPVRSKAITIAVKVKKKESKAADAIASEVLWLKTLNERAIGPRMLFSGEDYVAYEFAEGEYIEEWLPKASKEDLQKVLQVVFQQCYVMDKLQVNKEEMHHPLKHIIIDRFFQPVLIDFERCKITDKPKNVTQLMEFICRLKKELENKGLKVETGYLRSLAKEYKKSFDKALVEKIIKSLSG